MTLVTTRIKMTKPLLMAAAFTLGSNAYALGDPLKKPVLIPVIEHAQIFADFTDDTPAVVNYFTSSTEEQIITFYQQEFGDSLSQERKRERLTLTYQKEKQAIRIVISQQNKKRQVDIIVE